MTDASSFDAFYDESRNRLLVQAYALTGDLPAAKIAVRDAFVAAWHHWRKVGRLEDPERNVRPHAWRNAQRRHSARVWHRDKSAAPEATATLSALSDLTLNARKALLLTELAGLDLPEMGRELGAPRDDAERTLRDARAAFATSRGVEESEIAAQFEPLWAAVADTRWPRATIIRRTGGARRRAYAGVGAVLAAAAMVVAGVLVSTDDGPRSVLDRQGHDVPTAEPSSIAAPEISLQSSELLAPAGLKRLTGGQEWRTVSTVETEDADAMRSEVRPCEAEPIADPRGLAATARTFAPVPAKGTSNAADSGGPRAGRNGSATPAATAAFLQSAELSRSIRGARNALARSLDAYGACGTERVQLLSTHRIRGLGEQAMLISLRQYGRPEQTMTVGLARTGRFTTTTVMTTPGAVDPDLRQARGLLTRAVSMLCTLPEGGACAGRSTMVAVAPLPTGAVPAMLSELDLPPLADLKRAWVGTEPRRPQSNLAATRCDNSFFSGRFDGAPFRHTATRTLLIPRAKLPAEFGLTETVGTLPVPQARAFVRDVRGKLARCEARDDGLGTEVAEITTLDRGPLSMTAWRVSVDVSDNRSVTYLMSIIRRGGAVAQLGFVPAPNATMTEDQFIALSERASMRLLEMPKHPAMREPEGGGTNGGGAKAGQGRPEQPAQRG